MMEDQIKMIIRKDSSVHSLKELFNEEHYEEPIVREHDIEYFCDLSKEIGFGELASPRYNVLVISYPSLSHTQIKFLVNILMNPTKKVVEPVLEYCCRASIVHRGTKKALIIKSNGFINTELNNNNYSLESKFFLDTLINMWSHLSTNIEDLWLNGKGKPDEEEDEMKYTKK